MRDPEEFDAFYKDARVRLLLQTFALTGDLPAARNAVRDAFVIAWHHWPKANRNPEAWTRPHAFAQAQRRHTARIWHREKGLDDEVRATLDALGKLTVDQRKILVLTVFATGSIHDFAQEIGLTHQAAEQELQTAMAQLALHRGVPTPMIRSLFTPFTEIVEQVRLPRAPILRRAGAARRRTHTTVGVLAAVATLVVSGAVVSDAGGVRASLDRRVAVTGGPASGPGESPTPAPEPPPEPVPQLDAAAMLGFAQVARQQGGRWKVLDTHDNSRGDGLVVPCQRDRYADPRGTLAQVRTFAATTDPGKRARSLTQLAETSSSEARARRAYQAALGWFAGCTDPRAQLLLTQRVEGVGDEASMFLLRDWAAPVRTVVVGVARTGMLTTSTVLVEPGADEPDLRAGARLLATAVDEICQLPDGGACSARRPRLTPVRPLPVGDVPAMLSEVDLPPVSGVERPWVGTEPRQAEQNYAATRCDRAEFRGIGWSHNTTRTFLVPGARVSPQFGLTQTVGALPRERAREFVDDIRARVAACPRRDLGTEVEEVTDVRRGTDDLVVWRVTTEIADDQAVSFLVAIMRTGPAIGQLGFVPSADRGIGEDAFVRLAQRALDRLHQMPPPRRR